MASTAAEMVLARADDDRPGLRWEDETWWWHEVVAEATKRACWIRSATEGRKPHVGVLLENVPEFVFLLLGAALSGGVIVGINPTRRGAELATDIRHTDCAVVVTDERQAPLLDGLALGCEVVVAEDSAHGPALVEDSAHGNRALSPPHADDLYLLLFTSGSTGAPKAVRMTQGHAARTAARSARAFTPEDVAYCAMPLFHGNALLANFFPAMMAGASVALKTKFSASAFAPDIRRYRCTYFNYVGRALSYVLAVPESPDERDNELKWCLGSEASPRDRAEFKRRFGCPVLEGYGSSENAVIIQPVPGMPREALGKPLEGTDVAVIDPSTGTECPPARFDDGRRLLNADEAIGEIVGRDTLANFEGYYANPQADRTRSRDGWYWTGDLGYRDDDGVFYFAGRTVDWLRVDGENYAAGPVERILDRMPGVAASLVYAVPDPRTGDQVMAALELNPRATFDPVAFAAVLDTQPDLGTKWGPRFVRIVRSLPLTANGKIDRHQLRAERWTTEDPIWWRPVGSDSYRPFGSGDRIALEQAFLDAGRGSIIGA